MNGIAGKCPESQLPENPIFRQVNYPDLAKLGVYSVAASRPK